MASLFMFKDEKEAKENEADIRRKCNIPTGPIDWLREDVFSRLQARAASTRQDNSRVDLNKREDNGTPTYVPVKTEIKVTGMAEQAAPEYHSINRAEIIIKALHARPEVGKRFENLMGKNVPLADIQWFSDHYSEVQPEVAANMIKFVLAFVDHARATNRDAGVKGWTLLRHPAFNAADVIGLALRHVLVFFFPTYIRSIRL